MISARHAEALAYAQDGIPVFPCRENGKEPACPHGFLDATTDVNKINSPEWWSGHDYNLAIVPDMAGWAVIDLDRGGQATWDSLCPTPVNTMSVRTPSTGRHLYFKGKLPPSTRKLGPGIDTRGYGSYVLVPPSVINGVEYQWEGTNTLEVLPEWIPARLEKTIVHSAAKGEPVTPDHLIGLLKYCHDAEMDRNRWRDIVAAIRNTNLSDDTEGDNLTIALAWSRGDYTDNIAPGNYDGDDPVEEVFWSMPPSETGVGYGTIYHYARERGYIGPSAVARGNDQETFGACKEPPTPRPRFYAYTEDEQDALTEPDWIVPDLIPDQSVIMWYGPTGSYKSFLALDLALGLSHRVPTFGFTSAGPETVVYVAGEGPRSIARHRRPAWFVARDTRDKGAFFLVRNMPLLCDAGQFEEFAAQLKTQSIKPRLIILDTAATAMAGTNENDAKDATAFLTWCGMLRDRFHASVLFVHHTGKNIESGARGSSALISGVDAAAEFQGWETTRAVSVKISKMKDAEKRKEPWTFQGVPCGRSLAFQMTDAGTHMRLTKADIEFTGPKIGAVLSNFAQAITTRMLAMELRPGASDEKVKQAVTDLKLLARGPLKGYATRIGSDFEWTMPKPDDVEL